MRRADTTARNPAKRHVTLLSNCAPIPCLMILLRQLWVSFSSSTSSLNLQMGYIVLILQPHVVHLRLLFLCVLNHKPPSPTSGQSILTPAHWSHEPPATHQIRNQLMAFSVQIQFWRIVSGISSMRWRRFLNYLTLRSLRTTAIHGHCLKTFFNYYPKPMSSTEPL
ncbi:hypothetical protein BDW62DRAFT_171746 [Aspergillus aurantiobrunneus]